MLSTPVRRRFNGIDVLVLLLLAAVLVTAAARLQLWQKVFRTENKDTATVTFTAENVSSFAAEQFTAGRVLQGEDGETAFGVLQSASSAAAKYYEPDADGRLHAVYSESRRDITGILSVTGTRTDKGFYADGTALLTAGTTMTLRTDTAKFTVLITSVTVK